MKDRPDLRTLLETQEFFGLPTPALVEKDWFAIKALSAIHDVNVEGLTLAFGGGTALGRAYRLIERMSEDIDLRIIGDCINKRGPLKRLRREVTSRLAAAGFTPKPIVQHEDQYVRYDLSYDAIVSGQGVLRPEIKIELSAFPVCTFTEPHSVSSFIAQAKGDQPEVDAVPCVRLVETAADKFTALGRRAGYAFSGAGELDHTLVRHIYDLSRMDGHFDLLEAAEIALKTMQAEAASRADDYPAYMADPRAETLRTYGAIASHAGIIASYTKLMGDLVYGERPEFSVAFEAVQRLAQCVRDLR